MFALLFVLGVIGTVVYQRRSTLRTIVPYVDALRLLDFPAYTLQAGKPTTLVYIAPSGVSLDIAQRAISSAIGPIESITLTRERIAIPSPREGDAPAYADLWSVQCSECGPPPGSPPTTITPVFLLNRILQRRKVPAMTNVSSPARQLATILYMNAAEIVRGNKQEQPEFIPIGAQQSSI